MKTRLLILLLALTALPALAQSPFSTPSTPSAWTTSAQPGNTALPEEQAFRAEMVADNTSAVVRLTPAPGYYLYRHTFKVTSPTASLGKISTNKGEPHDDPHFGRVEVFFSTAELTIPVTKAPQGPWQLTLSFQGCQKDGICYPPMDRVMTVNGAAATVVSDVESKALPPETGPAPVSPSAPTKAGPSSEAEDQRLAAVLSDRPLWQAWGVFLGLGLLLGLTPCVLPMVPILLGLIAGANVRSTRQGFGLSAVYVLTHATVFAGLGALAAWAGAGVQATFQQWWVVVPMAALMAALGLAMVLGFNLQMPARLQQWAGKHGQGGQWVGVMVMGALSSLIVGPCVAPPLAGAVLFLAQSGSPLMGAGALFALGLGMGAPLLLAGAGLSKWLPQAGAWGSWLTRLMGVGFVGLGAWLATRAVPIGVAAGLAAGLMGMVAAWLAGRGSQAGEPSIRPVVVGLSLATALAAGIALQGSFAAPTLQPAQPLFAQVKNTQELNERLEQAQASGKTVVLDFYADWCTACLDMEKQTFADQNVRQRLQQPDLVMLKADVTDNTPEQRALMKQYGIIGPPATLFFQGKEESRPLRLVGFESTAPFLQRVDTAAQCKSTRQWAAGETKTQLC